MSGIDPRADGALNVNSTHELNGPQILGKILQMLRNEPWAAGAQNVNSAYCASRQFLNMNTW